MNEKICFLIMAHDRFDQLTRLLRALQHPGFDLYVHVDAKAGPVPVDPALAMVLEQPEVVNWGGYSMVTASLKLLQTAVAGGTPYRYFLLISGTDYPIRGNDEIYRFLCASENQYMHSFSNEDPFWHNRYRKFHFMDMHPWPRRLIHMVGFRIQGRLFPYRKLPLPLTVHFGSGWWTLTHDAVRYILRFVNENPAYAEFFRYSHAADEMFFQTILENSPFKGRIKPNLHYVDWSLGGSHPKVLDDEDFDKFAESGCLFARKFYMSDNPTVLDRIDRELRTG